MAVKDELNITDKWYVKLLKSLTDYGWIALIIIVIAAIYRVGTDIYQMNLDRANKQAEANLRIGKLEGEIEILKTQCFGK